jgi:hypothetical protein
MGQVCVTLHTGKWGLCRVTLDAGRYFGSGTGWLKNNYTDEWQLKTVKTATFFAHFHGYVDKSVNAYRNTHKHSRQIGVVFACQVHSVEGILKIPKENGIK